MKQRKEVVEALLEDLRKAAKLIDGVATKAQSLENSLDRSHFVRNVGEALCQIFELESELFDVEPDLTYDFLKPSLDPVNLDDALERLLSTDPAIHYTTVREFSSYMTDGVASQMVEACESGTGYEFAQAWWKQQRKPFIPVVKIYKVLRSERRFCRYQSAKLLEKTFDVKLWDSSKNDVVLEAADEWFKSWVAEQSA